MQGLCFRLVSHLMSQQQQQKGCLMVMADPSDPGYGKYMLLTNAFLSTGCNTVHLLGKTILIPAGFLTAHFPQKI